MDNEKTDPDKLTALLRGMLERKGCDAGEAGIVIVVDPRRLDDLQGFGAAVLEGITGLAGEMRIAFGDPTK